MHSESRRLISILFGYWFIFLIWQNILPYDAGSFSASLGKVILISSLLFYMWRLQISIEVQTFLFWSIFTLFSLIMLMLDENTSIQLAVRYLFPPLLTYLIYISNAKSVVTINDYYIFLKLVVISVTAMCFYSLIFEFKALLGVFSLSSAYGNELSSFFISNHEFGMYLVFGIASLYFLYDNEQVRNKFLYYFLLILLVINLIATISRTSMLACILIFFILSLLLTKGNILNKIIILLGVSILLSIMLIGFQEFIKTILLKEGNDAGRFDMWLGFIEFYLESSFVHQLFGYGFSFAEEYTKANFNLKLLHNAFLQALLSYGLLGLSFLIGIVIKAIINSFVIYKKEKKLAAFFISLNISCLVFMMSNTACLMESPIDSFMLSVFTIIIPKFVMNGFKVN